MTGVYCLLQSSPRSTQRWSSLCRMLHSHSHSLFLSFHTCIYFPHSTQLWYNSLHRQSHRKETVWHRKDFISLTVDSAVNDSDPSRVAFNFNGSSSKEPTWIRGNDTRGCALKQTLWMCLMPYTSHLTPHSSHTSWYWRKQSRCSEIQPAAALVEVWKVCFNWALFCSLARNKVLLLHSPTIARNQVKQLQCCDIIIHTVYIYTVVYIWIWWKSLIVATIYFWQYKYHHISFSQPCRLQIISGIKI